MADYPTKDGNGDVIIDAPGSHDGKNDYPVLAGDGTEVIGEPGWVEGGKGYPTLDGEGNVIIAGPDVPSGDWEPFTLTAGADGEDFQRGYAEEGTPWGELGSIDRQPNVELNMIAMIYTPGERFNLPSVVAWFEGDVVSVVTGKRLRIGEWESENSTVTYDTELGITLFEVTAQGDAFENEQVYGVAFI